MRRIEKKCPKCNRVLKEEENGFICTNIECSGCFSTLYYEKEGCTFKKNEYRFHVFCGLSHHPTIGSRCWGCSNLMKNSRTGGGYEQVFGDDCYD